MKITTILGSPRKKGNTSTILTLMENEFRSKGHEVERINLQEFNLNPCRACFACKDISEKPSCVQKDDANMLFRKLAESDAIVLSSPLYMWTYSAQMKAFLDRSLCIVSGFMTPEHTSLIAGKKTAFVVACAGPLEMNADLMPSLIGRWAWFAKCDSQNLVSIFPNMGDPDTPDESVKTQAKALVDRILNIS